MELVIHDQNKNRQLKYQCLRTLSDNMHRDRQTEPTAVNDTELLRQTFIIIDINAIDKV